MYASAGVHLQPQMTPVGEEGGDYFSQRAKETDSDSEEEQTLSFGSKQNTSRAVQKDLSHKLHKLNLKPLTSLLDKKTKPAHAGDRLWQTMENMTGPGKAILPSSENDPDRKLLAVKYKVFLEQCFKQQEYRARVDEVESQNKA